MGLPPLFDTIAIASFFPGLFVIIDTNFYWLYKSKTSLPLEIINK